ncbi:hypothetical protein C5470_02770 [Photorhabdus stackebrandtii]|uniref:Uncharacterized protein n=1 Tax=Photorhabdus stackebrandtii TaxID=1123042 RepID=A0A7X5QJE6_9GAMM|nr:hypothetical protein [Photorhabdus stackebrandtii]
MHVLFWVLEPFKEPLKTVKWFLKVPCLKAFVIISSWQFTILKFFVPSADKTARRAGRLRAMF